MIFFHVGPVTKNINAHNFFPFIFDSISQFSSFFLTIEKHRETLEQRDCQTSRHIGVELLF